MSPNPAGVFGPALELIVQRIRRLEEWTRFEAIVCDIRDALERYDDRLQQKVNGSRKGWEKADAEAESRNEWNRIRVTHLAPLLSFQGQIRFIAQSLDGDAARTARAWIEGLGNLVQGIERAFEDGSVPNLLTRCLSLRESVRVCLSDHLDVVRTEINELRNLAEQVRQGLVPALQPQPAPAQPSTGAPA